MYVETNVEILDILNKRIRREIQKLMAKPEKQRSSPLLRNDYTSPIYTRDICMRDRNDNNNPLKVNEKNLKSILEVLHASSMIVGHQITLTSQPKAMYKGISQKCI